MDDLEGLPVYHTFRTSALNNVEELYECGRIDCGQVDKCCLVLFIRGWFEHDVISAPICSLISLRLGPLRGAIISFV